MRTFGTVLTAVIPCLIAVACSSPIDPDGLPDGPSAHGVSALVINPVSASVALGNNMALDADALDRQGRRLSGRRIDWSSTNPSVVHVSSDGQLTTIAPGEAVIRAHSEGRTGVAEINVTNAVASIRLNRTTATIPVDGSVRVNAQPRDSANKALPGIAVDWSSSHPDVASVNDGVISGQGIGSATVTASVGAVSATVAVTVRVPPVSTVTLNESKVALLLGETTRLEATVKDSDGNTLEKRIVTWSSSNTNVATVDQQGKVTTATLGKSVITATSEGKKASAEVSVVPPTTVQSVTVSPSSADLMLGDEQQFSATVRDGDGRVMAGKAVTWQSSNAGIASVSSNGQVRAIAPGSATITATSEGSSGTASVVVRSPAVATIVLSPSSISVGVGRSGSISVSLYDDRGQRLTGRLVSWRSGNTGVATVSNGNVTGVSVGETTITATSEGISAAVPVTVVGASVGSSNEPSGFIRRAERPFKSVEEDGWWSNAAEKAGAYAIVSSPSGPKSPGTTGQIRFDANFNPGSSPARTTRTFDPSSELYVGFWLRLSSNYQGASNAAGKVIYLGMRGSDCKQKNTYFVLLQGGPGSTQFGIEAHVQDTELHATRRLRQNRSTVIIQRERWYFVEQVVKRNTPGISNGEVHMWIDGTKIVEYRDIGFTKNSSCANLGQWYWMGWWPVWGDSNNHSIDVPILKKHGPFYQWIDHIYISGSSN